MSYDTPSVPAFAGSHSSNVRLPQAIVHPNRFATPKRGGKLPSALSKLNDNHNDNLHFLLTNMDISGYNG